VAQARSGIASVDIRVKNPIECHRCRPRAHHGDGDPEQLVAKSTRVEMALPECQQCSREGKGQREHGVLELDHFER
jgi:hypothetical protein